MEVENTTPASPSPWRTIWFSPRHTIRRIIDADVRPSWVPVIALGAMHQAVTSLRFEGGSVSAPDSTMPVVVGVLQLVFSVLVGPFLLAFVGGWLGGEADPEEIRHAVAWSYVPVAVAGVVTVPVVLAFGVTPDVADPDNVPIWHSVAAALAVMVWVASTVWNLVLQVGTFAEVQRFSILRSIACMVILLIPLLLLVSLQ